MNLIEQLGGYEKAKLIVDNQINSEFQTEFFDINGNYYANDFGDLVIYINDQWVNFDNTDPKFELFSITDLEAEVIQYRRQHKIFEVGDYFCYEKKYLSSDPLDGNDYEKLNQIDKVDFLCGWIELVVKRGGVIRHATNAEIEAGKRLGLTNGKI